MSQVTLTRLMTAALTTRAEALSWRPGIDEAWSEQFALAMQEHLNDEACRWLASKGCYGLLPNGLKCLSVGTDHMACDRCEAQKIVNKNDADDVLRLESGKGQE